MRHEMLDTAPKFGTTEEGGERRMGAIIRWTIRPRDGSEDAIHASNERLAANWPRVVEQITRNTKRLTGRERL